MAVGADIKTCLAPDTIEADHPQSHNDQVWSFEAGGRHGNFGAIDLDWGRADDGLPPFEVEISVNDAIVALRVPPLISADGRTTFERIYAIGRIRDSNGNQLRIRS